MWPGENQTFVKSPNNFHGSLHPWGTPLVLSLCNTEVYWFPSHLHKLSTVSSFYFSFPYKRSLPKSMLLAGFWVCVYVYFNSLSYFTCKTLIIKTVEIISWIPNLYFSFGKSPWIIHDFSISLIFQESKHSVILFFCFLPTYQSPFVFLFYIALQTSLSSITYSNKKGVLSWDFLYIIFPIYNLLIHFKLADLNILLKAFFSLLNLLGIFTISVLDTSFKFPTTSHNDYSSREYTFFLAFHSL